MITSTTHEELLKSFDIIKSSVHISTEVKEEISNKLIGLKTPEQFICLKKQLDNLLKAIDWRCNSIHPKCIICGEDATVGIGKRNNVFLCDHHHQSYIDSKESMEDFYNRLTAIRDINLLERDRTMLRSYNLGATLSEIGKVENISRQAVSYLLQQIPWYNAKPKFGKSSSNKKNLAFKGETDYPIINLCPYCYNTPRGRAKKYYHHEENLVVHKNGTTETPAKGQRYKIVRCPHCTRHWFIK